LTAGGIIDNLDVKLRTLLFLRGCNPPRGRLLIASL